MTTNRPGRLWSDWSEVAKQEFLLKLANKAEWDRLSIADRHSGMGGAETYLVQQASRRIRGIVKIGKRAEMEAENRAIREASSHFQNVCAVIATHQEGDTMGLLMSLAGGSDGETFSSFYRRSTGAAPVVKLIERLFSHALARSDKTLTASPRTIFQMFEPNMASISAKMTRDGQPSPNLAEWWCSKARDTSFPKARLLYSHGDLHGRNILVSRSEPYLIDFGKSREWHAMYDPAKLEREIRLKLLLQDAEDVEARSQSFADYMEGTRKRPADADFQKACQSILAIRNVVSQSALSGDDWKVEYNCALLFHYMCAAVDPALTAAMRTVARSLAEGCRRAIGSDDLPSLLPTRQRVLCRMAYAWLRMDQLPSGGWGKSLPQWMERLWEGDNGTITRSADMLRFGGTDFSCLAFYHYTRFVTRFVPSDELPVLGLNRVATNLHGNLEYRIHESGADMINAHLIGRAKRYPVQVRHTAIAIIALLLYGRLSEYAIVCERELRLTGDYLVRALNDWRKDQSHVFAMFAALSKLEEFLCSEVGVKQFRDLLAPLRRTLVRSIQRVLPEIRGELSTSQVYPPRPSLPEPEILPGPFFTPYGKFWRMERTSLLMYLPLLVSEDGMELLPVAAADEHLKVRLRQCLDHLLAEAAPRRNGNVSHVELLRYHEKRGQVEAARDWGLTAEFVALLRKPAVQTLLGEYRDDQYRTALAATLAQLDELLVSTFDSYHDKPKDLRFTQAVSFCRYLDLPVGYQIGCSEVSQLDGAVVEAIQHGLTERKLHELVGEWICVSPSNGGAQGVVNTDAICDLLIEKLQSGEHTLLDVIAKDEEWRRIHEETIRFYDGPGGKRYSKRYEDEPIEDFVSSLARFWPAPNPRKRFAVDIGCGPGQYAELLKKLGFEVDLYDASRSMLRMAAKRLGIKPPKPRNIYDLASECRDKQYDLVFACAMMVHVPLHDAHLIYEQFYRILKPGGVLFVNYKIGDHSLVARDGRYFQFYRSWERPLDMLRAAGFRDERTIMLRNWRTSYDCPKEIQWANFFLRRP